MGKVVAVWSSTKKTGKTVFLYMLANRLSAVLGKDMKMLVFCANLSYGNLLDLFRISRDELNIEDIVNYSMHPDGSRIDLPALLPGRGNICFLGSNKAGSTYIGRNLFRYEQLMDELKDTFDLCLIDTVSGAENTLTNMIVNKSDYVINVINQDKELLDRFRFISGKDLLYVVNRYRDIFPGRKELMSSYGLRNLFTLPCCDVLQDMKNRGRLEFYAQLDTGYNKSLGCISEFVAKRLGLKAADTHPAEDGKRAVLKGFLGGFISQ